MVIVLGNGHDDSISNLRRDFAFHRVNTLVKGMNSTILPLAIGK